MSGIIEDLLRGYADLKRILARELSADDAADIAQSSFAEALCYSRRHEVLSPAGLVFTIARNLRIDTARRKRHAPQASIEDMESDVTQIVACDLTPERRHAGKQRLELLSHAIDALPPRCREAFILCKLHDMSYEEAAREMGISSAVVKKHLVEAMKQCRSALA